MFSGFISVLTRIFLNYLDFTKGTDRYSILLIGSIDVFWPNSSYFDVEDLFYFISYAYIFISIILAKILNWHGFLFYIFSCYAVLNYCNWSTHYLSVYILFNSLARSSFSYFFSFSNLFYNFYIFCFSYYFYALLVSNLLLN